MIDFEPFDLADVGLTLDILDLAPNPLPDLPPKWRKPRWYQEGGHETLEDRAMHDIERFARPVLDRLGVTDDDAVLEREGRAVSLNELLAVFALAPEHCLERQSP